MGRFDLIKTGMLTRNRPGIGAVFGRPRRMKRKIREGAGIYSLRWCPRTCVAGSFTARYSVGCYGMPMLVEGKFLFLCRALMCRILMLTPANRAGIGVPESRRS